jgi:hypothetical protein
MKKALLLLLTISFFASCAPRRMSCYGKRCVENTSKKEIISASKINS